MINYSIPPVSDTTAALIDLLRQRDAAGRAKYGATLDRTDLTHAQWLQHMAEELLDGAGYALAALRTLPAPLATEQAGDLCGFTRGEDGVPDPDTTCIVLVEFNGELLPSIDSWTMQRESPAEWSSATVETGYYWDDHDHAEVLFWKPLGPLPSLGGAA